MAQMFTGGKITEYIQDGNVFYIRPYNPFKSIRLLGDLQKLILPVIGDAFGGLNGDITKVFDKKLDSGMIQQMAASLSDKVSGNELEQMTRRILDKDYVSVSMDGQDAVRLQDMQIEQLFTDDVTAIFPLVFEVLKVNYAGFSKLSKIRFGEKEDKEKGKQKSLES